MEHFVLLFEENILVRCGNWNQTNKTEESVVNADMTKNKLALKLTTDFRVTNDLDERVTP